MFQTPLTEDQIPRIVKLKLYLRTQTQTRWTINDEAHPSLTLDIRSKESTTFDDECFAYEVDPEKDGGAWNMCKENPSGVWLNWTSDTKH